MIALEDSSGTAIADSSYEYDPYGELACPESQADDAGCEEPLSEAAEQNPFRFQGFYYDSGVRTYDMLARDYRPDVGRFNTADRFESASADLELQSDPLTQNRYAFAGGNPVSRVEFDGHNWEQPAVYDKHGGGEKGAAAAHAHAQKTYEATNQEYVEGTGYDREPVATASPDRTVHKAETLRAQLAEHPANPNPTPPIPPSTTRT